MVARKNLGIELKCFTWLFGIVHLQSQNKISIFCDFQVCLIRWLVRIMSEQSILCLFLLWTICYAWRKILFVVSGCKSQPSQPAHETKSEWKNKKSEDDSDSEKVRAWQNLRDHPSWSCHVVSWLWLNHLLTYYEQHVFLVIFYTFYVLLSCLRNRLL